MTHDQAVMLVRTRIAVLRADYDRMLPVSASAASHIREKADALQWALDTLTADAPDAVATLPEPEQ